MRVYMRYLSQMWRIRLKQLFILLLITIIVYLISHRFIGFGQLEAGPYAIEFLRMRGLHGQHCPSCVTVNNLTGTLMRNGKVFRFVAGQMDYYRIPEEYWEDRMQKAKAVGLDAIAFYIPWNYHERDAGQYDFSGKRDIVKYVKLIQKYDMLALARIGPYICAEWTLGGLPPWLWNQSPKVRMRALESVYFNAVKTWFSKLLPMLKPLLQENGGPIFMVQIENEYGERNPCDNLYMLKLYNLAQSMLGNHVIYFTVDMPKPSSFMCNNLLSNNVVQTTDFRPCVGCEKENFELLNSFHQSGPLINMEYYTGWFDTWGQAHHTSSPNLLIESLWRQLNYSSRVSVSLYMFHGGTTFGLWNGAHSAPYAVETTSYDYDAPLSEAGDLTVKYMLLRQALFQFKGKQPPALPTNTIKKRYPQVKMTLVSHLLHLLTDGVQYYSPVTMEDLKQYEGFLVYITNLPATVGASEVLTFDAFADVVHAFTINQKKKTTYHGSLLRNLMGMEIELFRIQPNDTLLLLVENQGYVNFGNDLQFDQKGIKGPVFLGKEMLKNWYMFSLCFNKDGLHCPGPFVLDLLRDGVHNLTRERLEETPRIGRIYQGSFYIHEARNLADTFINPKSFGHGLIYINDILLGRYDQFKGPQLNLFVPKPFLKLKENKIVIVELAETGLNETVVFNKHPLWLQ